jgi:hypothetical protein
VGEREGFGMGASCERCGCDCTGGYETVGGLVFCKACLGELDKKTLRWIATAYRRGMLCVEDAVQDLLRRL